MQGRMNAFLSGSYVHGRRPEGEGSVYRCVALIRPREARKKFFHLHFSLVWIGSRSTFALLTALLTGRLTSPRVNNL